MRFSTGKAGTGWEPIGDGWSVYFGEGLAPDKPLVLRRDLANWMLVLHLVPGSHGVAVVGVELHADPDLELIALKGDLSVGQEMPDGSIAWHRGSLSA